KYTFRVKAMNAEGVWSDSIAFISIYINPVFWKTWWFRLLAGIVITGLITFWVRRRIANIRKEAGYHQQQALLGQKLAETEMVALRAQMNPHFVFNCMNIIDGLITDNRKAEAKDFLQKFSKLVRLVLENSQYQLVPLVQDLKALRLYTEMEAIRYNHCFEYDFIIDRELLEENYKIPPLLLQPYVENAIIHGLRHKENGRGKLLVYMNKEAGRLCVTIEDNGVGRTRSARINQDNPKPHQQMGMKVTGKRIELLKAINPGEIEITISDLQPNNEGGTRVRLVFPLDLKTG
ncbi:MAG: histidine kinase, partial [Bacteroidota bacterium]|nr:histidine kinase [Bacteroidota bacterium]